jgi:endonuclease/exonuclease/phosphatase family metal-dependent hydrolase
MLVVTFNIQWGCGRDGVVDLARIARVIAGADLIALQEVERDWRPEIGDQVPALAALFPRHHHIVGPAVDIDGSEVSADGRVRNLRRQYGNMILSRWPIASARSWPLTKYPVYRQMNDQAILMEAVIAAPDGDLRFYNTHLNYLSADQRLIQVEEVLKIIREAPRQGPVIVGDGMDDATFSIDGVPRIDRPRPNMPESAILVGDFNMEPNAAEYARIVGHPDPIYGRMYGADRLADALTVGGMAEDAGVTFPPKDGGPAQRIDHCFVSYDMVPRVRRGWIDEAADGSDHQPVWVEFGPPANH